jgi:hypothetical protein
MFRACSTCKKPIPWGEKYFVCSVSTCQRNATNFVFCSLDCWDAHVPTFRHKDSWAEERKAPQTAPPPEPIKVAPASKPAHIKAPSVASSDEEVLIVASKLKAYIRDKSGMNTAASVMDVLSDKVRKMSDQAIHRAELSGRKTVLDRDVE